MPDLTLILKEVPQNNVFPELTLQTRSALTAQHYWSGVVCKD